MATFDQYANPISQNTEEQELRSMLRKRFLRSLMYYTDKHTTFKMYERTTVNGDFVACDYTPAQIHVTNLETPSGCQPRALLRTSDMLAFSVKVDR